MRKARLVAPYIGAAAERYMSMIYYYVVVDFYPNLKEGNEYEEIMIPYHTYEEALFAIDAIMDMYNKYNNEGKYNIFWTSDVKKTIGFISIEDEDIIRIFRFEIMQESLEILKIK